MSRAAARRDRRAAKAAHVAAGTWQPKPPVGRKELVYCVGPGLAPAMASDMARGREPKKKIRAALRKPSARNASADPARDALALMFEE